MKTTKSILVFAVTYIIGYLFLSALGCMFFDADGNHNHYSDILGNKSWFIIYSLFIGVWIALTASHEYYESLEIKKKY
jgi:H+/Cl- antiporter ClcA